MAEESFPYQEIATGDRTVSASMFAKHIGMMRSRGVASGVDQELKVQATSPTALAVEVLPGAAYVGLTELRAYRNTLTQPLTIFPSDFSNARHDLVVLDLSTSTNPDTRRVTVLLIQGQPAATPLDPVLIQTESRYMLPLARIVVPANANSIANSDIVDLRAFSQPVSGGAPDIPLAALLQNIRDNRALICFSDLTGFVSTTDPWDLGMQASTSGSAAIFSAPTDIGGGQVSLKTGTTFNSQAYVGTLSRASIDVTRNPYFACRLKPDAGGSTLFAQGWGWNSQTNPGNYILFVWHRAIFRSSTTGNLFAVTSNGATETTTDLGAVYTLGDEATFEIESPDGGTTWLFRIDGVVVASHTTDVPTINLYTTVGIQNNTIGGTDHRIDNLDFVYSHQDRS